MVSRMTRWKENARTTVLTVLLTWAGLLFLAVLLRFAGPVVIYTERVPFGGDAWTPFPGFTTMNEYVREWDVCRRHSLLVHQSAHWEQQLQFLLVGMWGPYLAGRYLGLGDAHLYFEAEANRRAADALRECAGPDTDSS